MAVADRGPPCCEQPGLGLLPGRSSSRSIAPSWRSSTMRSRRRSRSVGGGGDARGSMAPLSPQTHRLVQPQGHRLEHGALVSHAAALCVAGMEWPPQPSVGVMTTPVSLPFQVPFVSLVDSCHMNIGRRRPLFHFHSSIGPIDVRGGHTKAAVAWMCGTSCSTGLQGRHPGRVEHVSQGIFVVF